MSTEPRIIDAKTRWGLVDLRDLWYYRDLLYFLVWRDIKVRYAQSVLGVGWAVIQPVFLMIVFTLVFGRLARLDSDGAPYAIFSYVALVPWTYFSNALTDSTTSLVQNSALITKVYFPRIILPLSSILSKLIDFTIALGLVIGLLVWYKTVPNVGVAVIPLLVLLMILTAAGLGIWMASLAIQYRDIKYALTFIIQMLMFASPVVYPLNMVPERYQILYSLNPMVGVIEGFRSAFLATNPMPWNLIGIGFCVAIALLVAGTFYFRRNEESFADVV
ncbi:MAG: ABC transporter permease [SAR202 cluster bacterium]|nr:ABC transporter permease [SAR202 cluster bacterium]